MCSAAHYACAPVPSRPHQRLQGLLLLREDCWCFQSWHNSLKSSTLVLTALWSQNISKSILTQHILNLCCVHHFLLLFSHSPSHKSHPNTPIQTVKNIFQSFEAPFPSQQLRLNVGCLQTTQNLAPNWSVRVLHSAGRRLATLLCKLRIIRQSEF